MGDAREIGVDCEWVTSGNIVVEAGGITPLQTIDVAFSKRHVVPRPLGVDMSKPCVLVIQSGQDKFQQLTAEVLGQESAYKFLDECLQAVIGATHAGTTVARFVIPLQSGTIIRSDIVPFRLEGAFWVDKAESFASPLQVYPGSPLSLDTISLADIFRASAGAALLNAFMLRPYLKPGTGPFIQIPPEIEVDFKNKLSMPWISAKPIPRKRLILVGSSNQDPEGGGWTQFAQRAAVALGIDLVFIDRADGWLARGDYASWYEALLPAPASWWAEPSANELVKIVEDYIAQNKDTKIDGIATSVEALQLPVSIAASRLGLPHENPSAFERATNKYKLGLFQNRPAFLAASVEDVLAALIRYPQNQLTFPLIVKPYFGLNSEGVTRVDNASELEEAIEVAKATRRSKDDVGDRVLVERYCEGPEVDVNMILVDGEVIFSEICDDFPKGADVDDVAADTTAGRATSPVRRRNFQETNMVFPSALPDDELAALQTAVKDTIQGLGFKNGVMHVEARIAHSKCSYQPAGGVVDLRPRKRSAPTILEIIEVEENMDLPTPWIIEINPRPPGLFASQTPGLVYGIDYWGVTLLLSTGDKARASVLSRPFSTGAQNHTVLVMIRAEFDPACEGIFDSDDVCVDLLKRHPELRQHIGRNGCLLKRGQRIPHPSGGRNTFVAYINVFSRKSRQEALEIAKKVRDEIRYEIR
ncbi:hypothetical protein RRF57_010098 [Xylaria bambusicola]|uniref:ATP-grasp domain-containing protein n=1 Tax=Xylaria bambusicola TaxID=326684 RepID=A0AAN7V3A6_9PEZI